jgi:hypothetical protein
MEDVLELPDGRQRQYLLVANGTAGNKKPTAIARRIENGQIEGHIVRSTVAFLPTGKRAHREIHMGTFSGQEKIIG